MLAAHLLDVLLMLIMVAYFVVGWSAGLVRTIGSLLGLLTGAAAAFLGVPLLLPLVPSASWRLVTAIGAVTVLVVAGQTIGAALATAIRHRDRRRELHAVERFSGGALGLLASALACSLLVGGFGALGLPVLTAAASGSTVYGTITQLTPAPVQAGIAQLRTQLLQEGLPRISEALGGVTVSPGAPKVPSNTPALDRAAKSVVRISGNALACGQSQSGSGFVVATDRIVTNAHVVAGVSQPVVEAPNGQVLSARVVYFDPVGDLAVLATSGLSSATLRVVADMPVGTSGVVDGYPYGGPFTSGGAKVLARSSELVDDIYGQGKHERDIYTLAANIRPGNSGGPLLTVEGTVAGVVFAQNAKVDQLGYAISSSSLSSVAARAAALHSGVASGRCTTDG